MLSFFTLIQFYFQKKFYSKSRDADFAQDVVSDPTTRVQTASEDCEYQKLQQINQVPCRAETSRKGPGVLEFKAGNILVWALDEQCSSEFFSQPFGFCNSLIAEMVEVCGRSSDKIRVSHNDLDFIKTISKRAALTDHQECQCAIMRGRQ